MARSRTQHRSAGAAPLFLPAVTYDSGGTGTNAIAVADVNGDGNPDLIVANNVGNVGVLLGNGDGTFRPAVVYSSGGIGGISIAVADVNGDGKPDLVVAGPTASTPLVGVFLGNGDGTFQPVVTYATGGLWANGVAIADVNGDGRPDLLVANGYSGTIGVLLGNGDGTFQPAVTYGSGTAVSIKVADVNGDGKLDLVVANFSTTVSVLLGNGDGTFGLPAFYNSGGDTATAVAVADVNGDGKPDLLVSNYYSASAGVLLGNGDGTFQPVVTYSSGGSGPSDVAAADVDGDGKPDLLVANAGSGSVGVLLGNGDGTFQPAANYSSGGASLVSLAIADVNHDGKPDVLAANHPGTVGVLLNNANQISTSTTLGSSPNPSALGQVVTFTATVTSHAGTPTGTVNFFDGTALLGNAALANGTASFAISTLAQGSHSITTAYLGAGFYAGSTSAPLTQLVGLSATTTSLASSPNPALTDQRVTYTATVASQNTGVTGTVTFLDGNSAIATLPLTNNRASYSTFYKFAGVHSITAIYSGDANNSGSTSPTLLESIVQHTKTVLSASSKRSYVGQSVTFTATVMSGRGPIPDGDLVTFYDGRDPVASVPLAGGVATYTTSFAKPAWYYFRAIYSGDANFEPSTGRYIHIVKKYPTTANLSSSPNPSHYGDPVTFTVIVSSPGPMPTGWVYFMDHYKEIGYAPVNGGVATFTISTLAAHMHPIRAHYSGDDFSQDSAAHMLKQVVLK